MFVLSGETLIHKQTQCFIYTDDRSGWIFPTLDFFKFGILQHRDHSTLELLNFVILELCNFFDSPKLEPFNFSPFYIRNFSNFEFFNFWVSNFSTLECFIFPPLNLELVYIVVPNTLTFLLFRTYFEATNIVYQKFLSK